MSNQDNQNIPSQNIIDGETIKEFIKETISNNPALNKKDLDPKLLLSAEPDSISAHLLNAKLQSMKNPKVVDKKFFRTTEIARILTSLFLIGIGMLVEYYFPQSKIVGDWSTGGCIIASGAGILAMVFILLFANKGLDIYERYILINNKKSKGNSDESSINN